MAAAEWPSEAWYLTTIDSGLIVVGRKLLGRGSAIRSVGGFGRSVHRDPTVE